MLQKRCFVVTQAMLDDFTNMTLANDDITDVALASEDTDDHDDRVQLSGDKGLYSEKKLSSDKMLSSD